MSIENQATFWLRNICVSEIADVCGKAKRDITEGLEELQKLLRNIYSDYHSFEISDQQHELTKIGIMADDLANYHCLINTVECLYQLAKVGLVQCNGSESCLTICKLEFQKVFKKPVAVSLQLLENYSFYYRYYKKGAAVSNCKQCDTFDVYYDNNYSLIDAMQYFAKMIPEKDVKKDYAPSNVMFYIADYNSVFNKMSTSRTGINFKRFAIANTLGMYDTLWLFLSNSLEERNLLSDLSLNPYVFPCWNIKYLLKKKTICTFKLGVDSILVGLPLSYELAKELILTKKELPRSIGECLAKFGCVHCKHCANESNIEIIDEIRVCRLQYSNFVTEDARMIAIQITTMEEAIFIIKWIDKVLTAEVNATSGRAICR